MPLVGWALSGDRSAYQYLPDSVERYLAPDELASAMSAAGFTNVGYRGLMLGTIAIHWGVAGFHGVTIARTGGWGQAARVRVRGAWSGARGCRRD